MELTVPHPETPSRWLAVATLLLLIPKTILLIPHIIVLYFLGIVAMVVAIFAQIVVLFTGAYPPTAFRIVRGVMQWQARMNAYMLGLTDTYPPFSLD